MALPNAGRNSEPLEPRSSSIPGNASAELKVAIERWLYLFVQDGFAMRAGEQLKLVEVSVLPNPNEPERQEAKVVLEVTVTEDMLNPSGTMHGACIIHLIDICTSFPITAMSLVRGGDGLSGVSQSIDVLYHAPASLGDKLRLVNTSVTNGARLSSARVEIWDVARHRLVASGMQSKMAPKL